jgi:hypothetical protein
LNPGSDNGSLINEVNTTNPIANLLSQASATVSQGKISARLPCGAEVKVVQHTYAQRRPRGIIGLADFSTENQNTTPGNVQEREGLLHIIRTSDVENASEQLRIDLYHQVLVVLGIMITLRQWSILPSSSPLESQE